MFSSYSALDTSVDTTVKITFLDTETKQPIKGIIIETTNTTNMFSGISDDNGIAAVIRQTSSSTGGVSGHMERNSLCRQFKKGVKLCTKDSEGVYAPACITFEPNTSCEPKMYLAKKPSKRLYGTPEEMAQLGLTRGGKLKFYPVCDPKYTDYPSKIPVNNRHCVNDFFANTKVQMLAAEELAKIYALEKHDQLIECAVMYEQRNGNDYLQCVAINGNEMHAYEFRFRTLNASKGWAQSDNITFDIQHSAADAVCRLPGGTYGKDYSWCLFTQTHNGEEMCPTVDKYAKKFGWNASWKNNGFAGTGCTFDFNAKDEQYEFRGHDIIDPLVFQNMSVQSNNDLILLLNQYVRSKTMDTFKALECNHSFNTYYGRKLADTDFEFKKPLGYIITCQLTTIDNKKYDLDFLFKNVSETGNTRISSTRIQDSKSGMQCITQGGQFDGEKCTSIGKIQCAAINSQVPGGAEWNETLGVCAMKYSKQARTNEKIEKYIKIGESAVIALVLSGGVGTIGELIVWTASELIIPGLQQYLQDLKNQYARDFVMASQQCPNAYQCDTNGTQCDYACNPNSNCAKDVLINSYSNIKHLLPDKDSNNTHNTQSQLEKAVTFAHDTLWEKITEKCMDDDFATKLKNASNDINWAETAITGASLILSIKSYNMTLSSYNKSAMATINVFLGSFNQQMTAADLVDSIKK